MGHTGKKLRITTYAAVGVLVLVVAGLAAAALQFISYRTGYCNISRSNNKPDVMYRLGYPGHVYGKPEKMLGGYASPVYTTDRSKDPKNAMPRGKEVVDFDEWSYTDASGAGPSGMARRILPESRRSG